MATSLTREEVVQIVEEVMQQSARVTQLEGFAKTARQHVENLLGDAQKGKEDLAKVINEAQGKLDQLKAENELAVGNLRKDCQNEFEKLRGDCKVEFDTQKAQLDTVRIEHDKNNEDMRTLIAQVTAAERQTLHMQANGLQVEIQTLQKQVLEANGKIMNLETSVGSAGYSGGGGVGSFAGNGRPISDCEAV